MTNLTPEQQAKIKDARKAAAIENGVKARVARRTLRAEKKRGKQEAKDEAQTQAEKARQRETLAVNLWDADGDGDVDELDAEIIRQYVANTQSWVANGEDTWLRHVEMADNPEVYMSTQGGSVSVTGPDGQPQDVQLDPDNEQAVAAFVKLHRDQAGIWRAALDAAQEELDALVPVMEAEEPSVETIVSTDAALSADQGIVKPARKANGATKKAR